MTIIRIKKLRNKKQKLKKSLNTLKQVTTERLHKKEMALDYVLPFGYDFPILGNI